MTDPKLPPSAGEPFQREPAADATYGTKSSRDMEEKTSGGNTPRPHDAETAARPGQQLGPYLLLEKLGEGGMGAVYKARHTRLNKIVALKVLPAHLTKDAAALGLGEVSQRPCRMGEQHRHEVRADPAGGVHDGEPAGRN
jgi:serine/threonine protein kinase